MLEKALAQPTFCKIESTLDNLVENEWEWAGLYTAGLMGKSVQVGGGGQMKMVGYRRARRNDRIYKWQGNNGGLQKKTSMTFPFFFFFNSSTLQHRYAVIILLSLSHVYSCGQKSVLCPYWSVSWNTLWNLAKEKKKKKI